MRGGGRIFQAKGTTCVTALRGKEMVLWRELKKKANVSVTQREQGRGRHEKVREASREY